MEAKKWYQSKMLWVNMLAFIALLVQTQTKFVISPEEQVGILAIVNLILRVITKQPLGK